MGPLSCVRLRARGWLPGAVALAVFLAAVCISLMVGSYTMTPGEVVATLMGQGNKLQNFAVLQTRLPRTVLAVLVGTALAFSGGVLQGVTRNPLAEPGMIGINAGAALAVVLWLSLIHI